LFRDLRIAVIIASTGRPTGLARWPAHCARQSMPPAQLIFSMVKPADYAGTLQRSEGLAVYGPPGLCAQRNRGLALVDPDVDIIAFFDDDYVPSAFCLEGIARFFREQPDFAGVTGTLLADGIHGPGISYEDACAMIRDHDSSYSPPAIALSRRFGLYGCNMAFRRSAIHGLLFDEALPKYAWQEDVDFARQVAQRGKIGGTNAFVGVHQGSKNGRSSGAQLGYSQIANPVYLMRKGTMSPRFAGGHMARNILANMARSLSPEPWVDRRGRLKGNMIAIADVLRGRDDPRRISQSDLPCLVPASCSFPATTFAASGRPASISSPATWLVTRTCNSSPSASAFCPS
jgi:hypothetical protein